MGRASAKDYSPSSSSSSSSPSSVDCSKHKNRTGASLSFASSMCQFSGCNSGCSSSTRGGRTRRGDLNTDLRLGLSIVSPDAQRDNWIDPSASKQREQRQDWPPIKSLLRTTLAVAGKADTSVSNVHNNNGDRNASLFVKVYMEGIPIGRKLDLLALHDYDDLISTLAHMFTTPIAYPNGDRADHAESLHVLTYEDREGDWMMAGDVPWEMFMTTVKRLKITRSDRC
ncbi:auxin-responsive protein IAA31 [Rhodamnia argentea]|uniref:Auxin-responsive protein n=1 Tax=Rhodamnia argentea TaxID=178133 RepID=A0A8B8Q0I9_9MYRT|nr:auxin-responsive protein IAA31 [Rhodamnia argentea]